MHARGIVGQRDANEGCAMVNAPRNIEWRREFMQQPRFDQGSFKVGRRQPDCHSVGPGHESFKPSVE